MRNAWKLLRDSAAGWLDDEAARLSAALAYYAVFSLAPLLVIVVFIISLVFGQEAAEGRISREVSGLVGSQTGSTIQAAVAATSQSRGAGLLATLVGMAVLLFGASSVFTELKNSLNAIWGVKVRPGRTMTTLIRDRFLSFSMILGIGFLLLISLVISAAIAALSEFMAGALPLPPLVWQSADFLFSFLVTTVLFAMIFRILPNVILRWKDVLPGALLTAGLFTVGKAMIAWYLGTSAVVSSFGAAGSVVVILLWVYYATGILFFGAEFTKVRMRQAGHDTVPDRRACLVSSSAAET